MSNKRDVLVVLEDGVNRAIEHIFKGKMNAEQRAHLTAQLRAGIAMGIIESIAEATHDHWSVDSLREAMRDILTLTRHVKLEVQEHNDLDLHADPSGMARVLGLPPDASELEVLQTLAERQGRAMPPRDDEPPREPEPA